MAKNKVVKVKKHLGKNRKDSFWYNGEIAYIDTDHGRYSVVAVGEIKVMFEEDGEWFRNEEAFKEALKRKLTDDDLSSIIEHDGWGNNNWFELYLSDADGDGYFPAVCWNYDEAIELLKIAVQEEIFKDIV